MALDDKIKVIMRVRPILRHDKDTVSVVKVSADRREIEVVAGDQLKSFAFNLCCGPDVTQAELFDMSGIRKLVTDSMRGYKNTCFAYGQTGSGKTFTMSGLEEKLGTGDYGVDNPTQGIVTRALQYVWRPLFVVVEFQFTDDKIQSCSTEKKRRGSSDKCVVLACVHICMRRRYLFACVDKQPDPTAFRVEASAIEIYNERVYDLLCVLR